MKVPITMEGPERLGTADYLFSVIVDVLAVIGAASISAYALGFIQGVCR